MQQRAATEPSGALTHETKAFLLIHGGARTRVTRIYRSGIQNRVRLNSALAETALGEESLYYSYQKKILFSLVLNQLLDK